MNCRHTNEMKVWSSQLCLRFKQLQLSPKNVSGLQRIRTHGLCVSALVLHQLSYEDPYVGSRPISWIHRTRERNETYEYYVNCGHANEMKVWFLLRARYISMNSTNWPAPNVWVFIAQLVKHCSANVETMGSNPVESRWSPENIFRA